LRAVHELREREVHELSLRTTLKPLEPLSNQLIVEHDIRPAHRHPPDITLMASGVRRNVRLVYQKMDT
jgi:hypothetical protein